MKNTDIFGFTKKGKGHKFKKNQDYILYDQSKNIVVAVICDGVSSCQKSDIGAKKVAYIVKKFLIKNFDIMYNDLDQGKEKLLKEINNKMTNFAKEKNIDKAELSTTLGFTIIKNNDYICGQIGDGIIGTFPKKGYGIKILPTHQSTLKNSRTYTIFNDSQYFEICQGKYSDVDGFLLTTDGLNNIIYYEDSAYLKTSSKCLMKKNHFKILKVLNQYSKKTADDISFISITKENAKYKTIEMTNKWLCKCRRYNFFEDIKCRYCGTMYYDLFIDKDFFQIIDKYCFSHSLIEYVNGKCNEIDFVNIKHENVFYDYINQIYMIDKEDFNNKLQNILYVINIDHQDFILKLNDKGIFVTQNNTNSDDKVVNINDYFKKEHIDSKNVK